MHLFITTHVVISDNLESKSKCIYQYQSILEKKKQTSSEFILEGVCRLV